jgi:hypothetical protein
MSVAIGRVVDSRLSVIVALMSLLALAAVVPSVAASPPDSGSALGATSGAQEIDADSVVLDADVRADGNASWEVRYRFDVDAAERETAFEELRAELENDSSAYLGPFEGRMREAATTAAETTGREMSLSEFTIRTTRESQPQAEFGYITFAFEWTGFADAGPDTIRAGDALDGLVLEAGERLQIRWPSDYEYRSSNPNNATRLEERRIVWRGARAFESGQPRVTVATADGPVPETDDQGGTDGISNGLAIGALGGVVLVAGITGIWWRRRRGQGMDILMSDTAESSGPKGQAGVGPATADDPPPELLSNEERVLQLLENSGGRLKQAEVADRLGWTAAKTSQVVGDLREQEQIESFRLGRENVLTLPDVGLADEQDESNRTRSESEDGE